VLQLSEEVAKIKELKAALEKQKNQFKCNFSNIGLNVFVVMVKVTKLNNQIRYYSGEQ
jgi:hypothetical protein